MKIFKRGFLAAIVASLILGFGVTPIASAKLLHHEKSPAKRQRQAQHKAKKAEKKMAVKKHHFGHG